MTLHILPAYHQSEPRKLSQLQHCMAQPRTAAAVINTLRALEMP